MMRVRATMIEEKGFTMLSREEYRLPPCTVNRSSRRRCPKPKRNSDNITNAQHTRRVLQHFFAVTVKESKGKRWVTFLLAEKGLIQLLASLVMSSYSPRLASCSGILCHTRPKKRRNPYTSTQERYVPGKKDE